MERIKTTVSTISNIIFLSFCTFIITFIWVNFYTKKLGISLILSLIVAITTSVIYIFFIYKKKITLKDQDNQNLLSEYTKNQLIFGNYDTVNTFILNLFEYSKTKKISINHYITNHEEIFLIFDNEELDKSTYINILKTAINQNITIFCMSANLDFKFNNRNITIYNYDDIFKKMVLKNNFLDLKIENVKTQKISFSQIIKYSLNKKYSKKFFLLSLLLLFSSFFTPYSIYYIVISSLLIILSIYCKFNKKFNEKTWFKIYKTSPNQVYFL